MLPHVIQPIAVAVRAVFTGSTLKLVRHRGDFFSIHDKHDFAGEQCIRDKRRSVTCQQVLIPYRTTPKIRGARAAFKRLRWKRFVVGAVVMLNDVIQLGIGELTKHTAFGDIRLIVAIHVIQKITIATRGRTAKTTRHRRTCASLVERL